MTELLEAGRATLDVERRKAVYDQMERVAQTDAPQVGLAWRSQGYGFWRHVQGFTVRPGFLFSYAALSVEEVTVA